MIPQQACLNPLIFTKLQLKVSQNIVSFPFWMTSQCGVLDKAGLSSMNSSSCMYKDDNATVSYRAITQML